jgi:hypothetical protein
VGWGWSISLSLTCRKKIALQKLLCESNLGESLTNVKNLSLFYQLFKCWPPTKTCAESKILRIPFLCQLFFLLGVKFAENLTLTIERSCGCMFCQRHFSSEKK